MPVAGQPRNPFGQTPDRIDLDKPRHPVVLGRTAGTMHVELRGEIQAPGQIRHMWRQAVNYLAAFGPYSWTTNSDTSNMTGARAFQVTRAFRYLTRSLYMGAGIDNTRFSELHSTVTPQVRHKPVVVNAGQQRGKPVARNRLTSFGQRVPTLNQPIHHRGKPKP